MTQERGPGDLIDNRFRLIERLGSGAMGAVWRALDEVLQREVALKEVRPADPGLLADPDFAQMLRTRVLREAQALARIDHPHVVAIHNIVDVPGESHPWLVMELVRGGNLDDRLAAGPMAPAEVAAMGRGLLGALRAAHAAGICHRDVKPANVLLRPDGRPVLTDFGIADLADTSRLTMTGELTGSPAYIAPERLHGREGNPASDLWSLGMLLYVAVEGVHPLRRSTAVETLAAVMSGVVPPASRAGALGPALAAVLVADPVQRATAEQLEPLLLRALDAGASQPGASQSGVPGPGSSEPGVSQTGASQPGASQSGVPGPGSSEPGASQTGASQPGASQPGASQSGAPQPGAPQPGAPKPGASRPAAFESGQSEAARSEAARSEAARSEAARSEAARSEAARSEAAQSESGAYESGRPGSAVSPASATVRSPAAAGHQSSAGHPSSAGSPRPSSASGGSPTEPSLTGHSAEGAAVSSSATTQRLAVEPLPRERRRRPRVAFWAIAGALVLALIAGAALAGSVLVPRFQAALAGQASTGAEPTPSSEPVEPVNLHTEDGMEQLIKALEETAGTTEFNHFIVYEDSALASVPGENDTDTVDTYLYQGGAAKLWQSGPGEPDARTVDVSEIDWDILPKLLNRADKNLKSEKSTSRELWVEYDPYYGTRVIKIILSGKPGTGGHLIAHLNGEVIDIIPVE